ncbi:MAG TPA: hypothetical protein VMW42_06130 [Desulfatiglandales bacterium]|nr:hypothetical protein [Desulfatiglandales bacterium]
MKEHPIIFSGPMVRAILDGRKTQTRRVIKPQPEIVDKEPRYRKNTWALWSDKIPKYKGGLIVSCPYGKPGDLLYVKETWRPIASSEQLLYRADIYNVMAWDEFGKWHPSIHMPRWASRITLEITDVRVERVQEISEENAIAEGVQGNIYGEDMGISPRVDSHSVRINFMDLWDSINLKRGYGWDVNPWVWVLGFKKEK